MRAAPFAWGVSGAAPPISPRRAGRGIGRAMRARSTRCSARTTNESAIRMQPPITAIIAGKTLIASKVWSWMDTPEATKPRPAAVITAPSNSKNAYIRLSPSCQSSRPAASHFSNYFGRPLPMAQALMWARPLDQPSRGLYGTPSPTFSRSQRLT